MRKRIYSFGAGVAEGDKSLSPLLGGKGANLAEMSRLGIAVPPGFTITTKVCNDYYKFNRSLPAAFWKEVTQAIKRLEEIVGREFGNSKDPLLVSVRSGAMVSMPGMMDTILNLGFSRAKVPFLAEKSGNPRFAWDTYRRLIQMFGDVILGVPSEKFEALLSQVRKETNAATDAQLDEKVLEHVATRFEHIVKEHTVQPFPEDAHDQLRLAIEAVFRSWMTPRAVKYRQIHGISEKLGTAVTVQAMVFGNRGEKSLSGVLLTRNPSTGEKKLLGEYLPNAQGEDVVAGIRTPNLIDSLEMAFPEIYKELRQTADALEKHYSDMQDIEFTVEEGKLWILQTRSGKRTSPAAIRIAVEMVDERIMDRQTALRRVRSRDLDQVLHPIFDPEAKRNVLAVGLPASPGAATGKIYFTADEAERRVTAGEKVILVRSETSPEDIHGMHVSEGILTSRGGMTSHAAVVARGMGKCCVVGCSDISMDLQKKELRTAKGEVFGEGTMISLDGSTGEVLRGELALVQPKPGKVFETFMSWADEIRRLKVRANADTPADCKVARQFGAQGIGLCRTEHMFFDRKRIDIVRQMILAETVDERKRHLDKILPMQLEDFREIFKEMRGLPVTIRLLDPPLHEFLPRTEQEIEDFAGRIEVDPVQLAQRIEKLSEFNPMLGHRGCRLAITFPEIYEMQVRAIIHAACDVSDEVEEAILPEIMVPLVADPVELRVLREQIVNVAEDILKSRKKNLRYFVGTMIELPRAALLANSIAKHADFFSFGTNDLTQTTFGLSRDDSSRFLPVYVEKGILHEDPFASLDPLGVLELVKLGTERGKQTNEKLKVGVCGEHGGDPASIAHFHSLGLNYVSCSPFRVPVARLAAAQAAIGGGALSSD